MKDKVGKWIGNVLILLSVIAILYVYLDLYNRGHIQCAKSDLGNRTFLISTFGYALLFVIFGIRLSSSKKLEGSLRKIRINKKLLVGIGSIIGMFSMIIYLLIGFRIQNFIEDKVDDKINSQLKIDGVPIVGIVERSYSKYYNRRHSKIKYDQIDIKYETSNGTFHTCYSLRDYTIKNVNVGDTLNFIISKSNPDYILLKK